MIKKLISTAIVSSVIGSASANPELGYMTLGTDQYQLFNATIAIDALPSELANKKLKVKLGSITDFYRHNIEYDKQVASLRFKVARDRDGKPLITVRSVKEITSGQLKAVVKLTVGNQKIYGIYDFKLTPNNQQQVTLNLLNTDHKPAEKLHLNPKAQGPSTSVARIPPSEVMALPSEASNPRSVEEYSNRFSTRYYQVTTGQSISRIAMDLLPLYPEVSNWRTLMKRLASLNPDAFINGNINKLRADAQLKLPGSTQPVTQAAAEKSTVKASEATRTETSEKPVIAQNQNQNQKTPSNIPYSNSLNSTIIIKDLPKELAGKDNLTVQLGSITDYYRQGIDYNQQVAGLRFDILANGNQKTVVRAHSSRDIDAKHLTAVVKFSAGRRKAYGIYEIHSDKTGRQIAFNLLDSNSGKKPQVVMNTTSSMTTDDITKRQALEALRQKLKEYEQAKSRDNKVSGNQPANKGGSSSQISAEVAKKKALEALRQKLKGYEQARKNYPAETADKSVTERITRKSYRRSSMAGQKTYRVAKGDTISTIAMELSKAYSVSTSWKGVMKLLVKNNPDAFINGDINKIPAGTVLNLPEADHYDHLYRVVAGDNVSSIAWRMQYKYPQPVGWKGMMEQIVHMNPEAFIDGNPNKLRANEILIIPDSDASGIGAKIQQVSQKQPESKKYNTYNHSKPEKNELTFTKPVRTMLSPTEERPAAQAVTIDHHTKPQKMGQTLAKPARQQLSSPKKQPVQHRAETTYKVTESESLAAIAHKLIPDYPQFDSWYDLLQELAKLNPSLFVNNDIGALRKGTVLQLPEKKASQQTSDSTSIPAKAAERNGGQQISERRSEETTGMVTAPSYQKISNSLLSGISKTPVYKVPEGYTISMVAIKLIPQFPEYDNWTSLMKAIYKLNPDAFINRDINKLRDNSQLKLPRNIRS
ncbi:LysM peptidoglycan-binding domain-containing protein [Endozoicomonas sp. SCSIO W0465]|uniref:FimV/HubP-related protein n=1 Tax=Endozoicomonas sp. SCSIO W0465 TaxID=2918516 RepID=UPI002075E443|nr:LysM peptidoglycan-binding domain-containing protein [Endozoicomonas sp. SCSIO W0465]USE36668.1 LysM peptidoglycan-binding domain-containing protein [Endozoicomonas sp. SCSIO W0465]